MMADNHWLQFAVKVMPLAFFAAGAFFYTALTLGQKQLQRYRDLAVAMLLTLPLPLVVVLNGGWGAVMMWLGAERANNHVYGWVQTFGFWMCLLSFVPGGVIAWLIWYNPRFFSYGGVLNQRYQSRHGKLAKAMCRPDDRRQSNSFLFW